MTMDSSAKKIQTHCFHFFETGDLLCDQAELSHDLSPSASPVLGLQMCTTTHCQKTFFKEYKLFTRETYKLYYLMKTKC